jgi:hypothetical protein
LRNPLVATHTSSPWQVPSIPSFGCIKGLRRVRLYPFLLVRTAKGEFIPLYKHRRCREGPWDIASDGDCLGYIRDILKRVEKGRKRRSTGAPGIWHSLVGDQQLVNRGGEPVVYQRHESIFPLAPLELTQELLFALQIVSPHHQWILPYGLFVIAALRQTLV